MPFPASRLTDLTVTGDVIIGPGAPLVEIAGMPASCMGDAVAGSVCVGTVVVGSPTVLFMGRPATRVTSSVVGANPETGIPVTTAVGTGAPTVLVP
ncbi:PAAR domain-containing protein [Singulisphaera sp. Ch08]|uniref:PAAR domain-containing protein n=1 Tax=Singulisphaera sp. Ch08 TaxID=3120278 RepID=A0AAU7CBW8_9BACT